MTQAPSSTISSPSSPKPPKTGSAAGPGPRQPLSDDVVVRCAGLSKTFKDFWMRNRVRAVDNIDLDIRRGEVFGLLGPNGSGKSTTIKMILGLLHPTAGRISVFGKRPEDVATKKLIGYLPEESYLYRFLNARETLEYYGRLFHQSRHQSQKRIDMLLEMVGLESAQRRPVGEYSKGMQRRIGLAQALINDPQLLILDEPTTGLDPIGTKQIKDLIVELASRGKTILLCSHLLSDVEDVCDRVSIMFGGKVRAQGTCDELLMQQDATTIQTAELSDQIIQEIEEVLARHGKSIDRVDHPRQRLEQLFLDIVHKAQNEGASTSGARAGGKIAGFLVDEDDRGAHLPENVAARQLVDELVTGAKKPTAADPSNKNAPNGQNTKDASSSSASSTDGASSAATQKAAQEASALQQSVLDTLVNPKATGASASSTAGSSGASGVSGSGSGQPTPPAPAKKANVDLSLINELVGEKTAPTPQRTEPQADSSNKAQTPPSADKPATPKKAEPSESASSKGGNGNGEEGPDSTFTDAINRVLPYDETKDGPKGGSKK